jgi:hypothetical protein
MADEIKRLNYFTSQFLQEADFKDEQKYHIRMRRLHNLKLHSPGVVEGLEVRAHPTRKGGISVSPGMAIDQEGREILLFDQRDDVDIDLSSSSPVPIMLTYSEEGTDQNAGPGLKEPTRWWERGEIVKREPPDKKFVLLAMVCVESGNLKIDQSVRAGARDVTANIVRTERVAAKREGGTLVIGDFKTDEVDESEQVIWLKDRNNKWDEKLLKYGATKGQFGRAGFGIHMHADREWGILSDHWTPLLSVEGGSGNVRIVGRVESQMLEVMEVTKKVDATYNIHTGMTDFKTKPNALTISPNGISASGSNQDQSLSLKAKGSGDVTIESKLWAKREITTGNRAKAITLSVDRIAATGDDPNQDLSLESKGSASKIIVNGVIFSEGRIEQEPWQEINEFLNGWEALEMGGAVRGAPVSYFKDSCGIVHLRGSVRYPVSRTSDPHMFGTEKNDQHMFSLPLPYAPQFPVAVVCSVSLTEKYAEIVIDEYGQVLGPKHGSYNEFHAPALIRLDGISFRSA